MLLKNRSVPSRSPKKKTFPTTWIINLYFSYSMHISEGILTKSILLGGEALTILDTAIGFRKLNYERIETDGLYPHRIN